jgi:hypothetical protein
MADKHILRIHDTQANLLATLKDKQIAWATDSEEMIWRNGNKFHFLGSGKYWNGSAFQFDNVDFGKVTLFDRTAGTILGELDADGGTFTLNFTGSPINIDATSLDLTGVSVTADNPTTAQEVATKNYVDSEITTFSGANKQIDSTGIKQGTTIGVNGGDNTKWDLGAGEAYVMDYSDPANITSKLATWTAQSDLSVTNLLTEPRTNVAISLTNTADAGVSFTNSFTGTIDGVSGTIYIAEKSSDNFTSEQLRKYAQIGRLVHSNQTNLSFVVPLQRHTESVLSTALTFIDLFPAINVSGNIFSPTTGVNLSVDKSEGEGFRVGSNYEANLLNPDIQNIPAASPTTHKYRYRDGSGGWTDGASVTALDPTQYDDGSGTLQSVNNNRWTAQAVFVFAGSGSMFVQYGQQVFSAKSAAIEALATIDPVLDENLTDDAVFRGWFVVRSGGTDTNDPNDFEWRAPLSERGGGTGTAVVVDLQTAYDNSSDPEILTDSTRGALTLKRGSAADTDCVVEVQNGSGTQTFCVDGNGDLEANSIDIESNLSLGNSIIFSDNGVTSFIRSASGFVAEKIMKYADAVSNLGGSFSAGATSARIDVNGSQRVNATSTGVELNGSVEVVTPPTDNGADYTNQKMLTRDTATGEVEMADIPSGGGSQDLQSVTTEGNETDQGIIVLNKSTNPFLGLTSVWGTSDPTTNKRYAALNQESDRAKLIAGWANGFDQNYLEISAADIAGNEQAVANFKYNDIDLLKDVNLSLGLQQAVGNANFNGLSRTNNVSSPALYLNNGAGGPILTGLRNSPNYDPAQKVMQIENDGSISTDGKLSLSSYTNASPVQGEQWNNGTQTEIEGNVKVNGIHDIGTDEASPQQRIGKNPFSTSAGAGISKLISGGSIFNDYKTDTSGTIFYRCAEGAEAVSGAKTFMQVDTTDASVSFPNSSIGKAKFPINYVRAGAQSGAFIGLTTHSSFSGNSPKYFNGVTSFKITGFNLVCGTFVANICTYKVRIEYASPSVAWNFNGTLLAEETFGPITNGGTNNYVQNGSAISVNIPNNVNVFAYVQLISGSYTLTDTELEISIEEQ